MRLNLNTLPLTDLYHLPFNILEILQPENNPIPNKIKSLNIGIEGSNVIRYALPPQTGPVLELVL